MGLSRDQCLQRPNNNKNNSDNKNSILVLYERLTLDLMKHFSLFIVVLRFFPLGIPTFVT